MPQWVIKKLLSLDSWGDEAIKGIYKSFRESSKNREPIDTAIKETFAVVRRLSEDLPEADMWGAHHEVKENGDIVLNKAALITTAAQLATDTGLTDEEKEQAKAHLLRHYEELEETPPESLTTTAGEMNRFEARIAGEMQPGDIPLAPGVDINAIKAGDDDPFEVVVEVPPGESKRGWDYTEQALMDVVNYINQHTLPGYLGHQEEKNISTEFKTPATHWVGATWKNGMAYFRGIVDKSAPDLKRWIRSKRITQTSIFGQTMLQVAKGKTKVVGYKPFSNDWTPLGRAGMHTRIVSTGEMDSTFLKSIGGDEMTIQEMLAALRAAMAKKEIDFKTIAGEMGVTEAQAVEMFAGEELKQLGTFKTQAEAGAKIISALGLTGEMTTEDAVKVAGEMAASHRAQKTAGHDALVKATITEKVTGEQAQALVTKMLKVDNGATKEQIAGEIETLLKDEQIKGIISKLHVDKKIGGGTLDDKERQTTRTRTASI